MRYDLQLTCLLYSIADADVLTQNYAVLPQHVVTDTFVTWFCTITAILSQSLCNQQ